MTTFNLTRIAAGHLDLRVTDDEELFSFVITDGELDQLMMEMCILIESEPEQKSIFAESA